MEAYNTDTSSWEKLKSELLQKFELFNYIYQYQSYIL